MSGQCIDPHSRESGDEPYPYIDVRAEERDDESRDEDPARASRPRRTNTQRTTAAKGRGRGRRGAEVTIGALICMAAAGVLTYWLLRQIVGYPRDACLVAAGLAAGLSTWLGPATTATRRRLSAAIAPGGRSGRARS